MIKAVQLPLAIDRGAPRLYTFKIVGLDLTGAAWAGSIRLQPDSDASIVDLLPVTDAAATGARLLKTGVDDDGVTPASWLRIQIPAMATGSSAGEMPAASELGQTLSLYWDFFVAAAGQTAARLLYGAVSVNPTATKPAVPFPLEDDPLVADVIVRIGVGSTTIDVSAPSLLAIISKQASDAAAQAAADRAQTAADVLTTGQNVAATKAMANPADTFDDGVAKYPAGTYFSVSSAEWVSVYKVGTSTGADDAIIQIPGKDAFGGSGGGELLGVSDGNKIQAALAVAPTPTALIALTTPSFATGSRIRTGDGFIYEVVDPSATDQHLTTDGGVKLYVVPGDTVDFDAFAPDKTATTNVSDALNLALTLGKAVRLRTGRYAVKNIVVGNVSLLFDDGAVIVSELGANDIGLRCNSGAYLDNPQLEVSNTAAPPHGGFGCAIAIGNYTDTSERVTGVVIDNPVLTCTNDSPIGLGISILGNVDDVEVNGAVLLGRFALGMQAHWGGTWVDASDIDNSAVTESYHPNNIRFNGITTGAYDGNVGYNVLSYSAAFDIHTKGIVNNGWERTFLITPGDIYNFVSVAEQKAKVCTGMTVDGISVIDPPDLSNTSSAYSQMLVNGLSQNDRNDHGQVGAVDGPWDLDIRNITVARSAGTSYNLAPLANIYYAAKTNVHVASVSGFEASTSSLFNMQHCYKCSLTIDGATQNVSSMITVNAAIKCKVDAHIQGTPSTITTSSCVGMYVGNLAGASTTLGADLAVADTSITLSGLSGGYTLMKYERIAIGTGYVTCAQTTIIPASGTIAVPIVKSAIAASSGDAAAFKSQSIGSTFTLQTDLIYQALHYDRADACVFTGCRFNRSGKYDVQEGVNDVTGNKIIDSTFAGGGQINNGTQLINIILGATGGAGGDGTTIRGCSFESGGGTPYVQYNIGILSGEVSNLRLYDNYFGGNTTRALLISAGQTDASVQRGRNQVWGNSTASGVTFALSSDLIGHRIGDVWIGRRAGVPSSGYHIAGEQIINSTPAVGSPKGWTIITTGNAWTSGTDYASQGNL